MKRGARYCAQRVLYFSFVAVGHDAQFGLQSVRLNMMKIIESIKEMQSAARELRQQGKKIGFVPTMGYLHEAHFSLMRLAKKHSDVVVVSIFVNPKQFNVAADLAAYPRDFERDRRLCEAEGVDIIFHPPDEEMYPLGETTYVNNEFLSRELCGATREGHFKGVLTVVAKLFNIVMPDVAVFGQKDAQQLRILQQMVKDMNFPLEIISGPTVREPDGLALSSRNVFLTTAERPQALCLRQALDIAEKMFAKGERAASAIKEAMSAHIANNPAARIDYVEIVDWDTLQKIEILDRKTLVALAVWVGKPRLIDNTILG